MASSPWKLTFANLMAFVFLLFISIAVKIHAGRHPKAPQIGLLNLPTSWSKAHATFYGDESAAETMGGACGYGNLHSTGYGTDTAALSTVLFHNGYSCGACFELKCVESPHCAEGKSIVLTATNLCPPNWAQDSNDGGWCNPPREHFDMSKPAFLKIVANWKAGIVPVMYRRIPCAKQGGIRFHFQGNAFWLLAFVMNVGGSGDIAEMWVKGEKTEWMLMSHNWGASYQAFETLQGQTLSFKITSFSTKKTVICSDVAPSNWNFGLTYEATINFS